VGGPGDPEDHPGARRPAGFRIRCPGPGRRPAAQPGDRRAAVGNRRCPGGLAGGARQRGAAAALGAGPGEAACAVAGRRCGGFRSAGRHDRGADRHPVLDEPRRGQGEARGAWRQGRGQRVEEDQLRGRRRGRRLQAGQGRGAGHRGLGRGAPAGLPGAARLSAADWTPTAGIEALRLRARLYALVRAFFAEREVLEVETPILSEAGNTEPNIESFSTRFTGHRSAGAEVRWLRTSPEYPLKRLVAAGIGDCYELGRVFRNGEAGGRHNPEFSMLEWYRVGWDHLRLADETVALVRAALALVG